MRDIRVCPWHDRHMPPTIRDFAQSLSRQHVDQPRLILWEAGSPNAHVWRAECRHAGVPVLELNDAPAAVLEAWLADASAFSAEFMTPVVVLGERIAEHPAETYQGLSSNQASVRRVTDPDWLRAREVALTRAVETSPLNQEFRRTRERRGWIRIGWQPDVALAEGNGLLLAWSSPLPLLRIRNFAARCPEITLVGPDAEGIAAEVAAQGISVTGWRFAVK